MVIALHASAAAPSRVHLIPKSNSKSPAVVGLWRDGRDIGGEVRRRLGEISRRQHHAVVAARLVTGGV
jgi:hypothetical protein